MNRGAAAAVGLVVLLVALVVTLLLVARSWESVAPQAIEVTNPSGSDVNVRFSEHGEGEAGDALRRGDLPNLRQARQATDARAEETQRALAEVD